MNAPGSNADVMGMLQVSNDRGGDRWPGPRASRSTLHQSFSTVGALGWLRPVATFRKCVSQCLARLSSPSSHDARACCVCCVNAALYRAAGAPSARTEVLLDLQATAQWGPQTRIPGMGALRQGKWKLLHGHTAVWKKVDASADMCASLLSTLVSVRRLLSLSLSLSLSLFVRVSVCLSVCLSH